MIAQMLSFTKTGTREWENRCLKRKKSGYFGINSFGTRIRVPGQKHGL